ncbi:MAG: helix-turn-helix transcriptional regulator, partial [Ruminococcus sp.]|nr:helix-turn-helix transcriptional regulator [Ruminococcus sp.]
MKKQTFGEMISSLRKSNGMTQLELADKMGVTDKAVSKWERDLSCPDINSIPKLAEIFGISVDELMQVKTESKENTQKKDYKSFINLVFKCVALAMGVAVLL